MAGSSTSASASSPYPLYDIRGSYKGTELKIDNEKFQGVSEGILARLNHFFWGFIGLPQTVSLKVFAKERNRHITVYVPRNQVDTWLTSKQQSVEKKAGVLFAKLLHKQQAIQNIQNQWETLTEFLTDQERLHFSHEEKIGQVIHSFNTPLMIETEPGIDFKFLVFDQTGLHWKGVVDPDLKPEDILREIMESVTKAQHPPTWEALGIDKETVQQLSVKMEPNLWSFNVDELGRIHPSLTELSNGQRIFRFSSEVIQFAFKVDDKNQLIQLDINWLPVSTVSTDEKKAIKEIVTAFLS